MKNNKGFTLVEIIVSLALIGIIATMMFPSMAGQFRLIAKTREITRNVAEAQQVMELEISDVKKAVQNGTTPDDRTSYTIFEGQGDYERIIYGYPRIADVPVGNHVQSLYTVIADNRMPDFAVATATVSIEFSNGSDTLDYTYIDSPSVYVDSTLTLNDPDHVNLTNIYRWYVSRPGFNIPMIDSPLEIEKGTKYPIFPDDYMIISGQSGTTLSTISEAYAGRHIICTVTPASNSGKMGATAVSNPVYVCGLPFIDDMELHLDASMISKNDSNATDGLKAKKWYHIQGSGKLLSTSDKNAVQGVSSKQPELIEEKIGNFEYNGLEYETYAKFLRFDGSDDFMDAKVTNTFSTSNMSVFIVARNTGDSEYIIYHNGEYPADLLSINNANKKVNIGYDGASDYSAVDIAEIMIYNGVLSASEIDEVDEYLQNKYQPVAPVISIYSLNPITATAVRGETFTMPSTVPANMSNGTIKDVAVTWSPSSIDTSTVGWKTSTAAAVANPSKTTTLTVNVVTISSLENLHEYVEQYEDYILPTTVPAMLSNGATGNVAVSWSVSDVDTSHLGDVTITGTAVLDGTKTMTLTVTVVPVAVDAVTLNKESTTIVEGGTETLVATVTPSNASNKAVTWSTSDPSVATVGSNGLITAVGAGTATITVTTVQGGKTDTCTVTVTNPVTGVTVTPEQKTVQRGGNVTLTATVLPSNATNKSVTWSSSNTSAATVSDDGVVTVASLPGNKPSNGTKITITAATVEGGYTDTCTITVGRPVTGVSLDYTSYYIDPGANFDLDAYVTPNNAYDTDVIWSSSNTSVATVNENGRVNGLSVGTVVITATTVDGGYTATCTVQVGRPVTSVTLTPESMNLNPGKTGNLTATVYPGNASNKTVTWSSSSTSVATVSSSGVVTAVGAGTVVITVTTNDGGFTDTCVVTVTAIPVRGVSLPAAITIQPGGTYNLDPTFTPADASNKNVRWTTSNAGVASIAERGDGTVTAVGVGTATITVDTDDGHYTDTCLITVPLTATDIDGDDNWFTLTFNAPIDQNSASMTGTSFTYSGKTIRGTKNSGDYTSATYTVPVSSNGTSKNVTIRVTRTQFLFWYSWSWSIISP